MQHYDVRLKAIMYRAMPRFFRLLGLPTEVAEYLTVEFPLKEKLQADGVVRFPDGRIVQLEWQAQNDREMLWRNLDYYKVIARQWPTAPRILQFLVYLGDSPVTMESEIERDRLSYGYDIFCMYDVEAREFLASESDDERVLAVLCASEDPRATIREILGSWKHLPAKELTERILDLQVLSQLRNRDTMVREESSAMPIEIDIKQNAFYKWAEANGAAMGEARGEARGKAEGKADALTIVLEARFGPLPAVVRARIASADVETLERWLQRLAHASTVEELFEDAS